MDRLSCVVPVSVITWVLAAGIIATVSSYAAWDRRQPHVKESQGPNGTALLRPELFSDEGNRLRRRALRWYAVAAISLVVGFPILLAFEGPAGAPACRDTSAARPA